MTARVDEGASGGASQPPSGAISQDPAATHERDTGGYRPALDGVRAIAVSSVVAYHFGFRAVHGGFLGVDVFFVLSGYLITSILLAEHARSGRISLTGFYLRRLRRLFPALALVVAAVAVDTALYASPLQLADRFADIAGALFYYANWHFIASDQSYFAGLSGASPLRHTWSLSIEEQFYFVWPLLLLVLLSRARARRWFLVTVVTVLTLLSTWSMAHTFDPDAPSRSYYGSDGRAQQLLVGVLLAVLLAGLPRIARSRRVWTATATLGLAALAISLNRFSDQEAFYYRGGALLVAVITALLVAGVELGPRSAVARLLSVRPIAWLGRISYGVYLWHWPVLVWIHSSSHDSADHKRLVTLARIGLTLLLSVTSFHLVERPIRSGNLPWVGRSGRRTVLAFAASLALLSAAAFTVTRPTVQKHVAQTGAVAALTAQAAEGSVQSCPHDPHPCVRVKGPSGGVLVSTLGDSTMQAYDPGLQLLARQHHFGYVQGAIGGCPIGHKLIATGLDGHRFKPQNHVCFERTPEVIRDLLDRGTDVFIATSSNEVSRTVAPDGSLLLPGTPAHLAATEAALDASVTKLLARGAYVVLVHMLPRGPGIGCLDSGPPSAPRCNVPVARDRLTPLYNGVYDKVAARHPGRVKVVDLSDVVCPHLTCSVLVHGIVMRYDGGHFTKRASEYVAPFLYDRIRAAGVPLP